MQKTNNELYNSFLTTLNVPEWSLPYLMSDTPWDDLDDDDKQNLMEFKADWRIVSFTGSKFYTRSTAFGLACTCIPAQCMPRDLVDMRSYGPSTGRIGGNNLVYAIHGRGKNRHYAVQGSGFRLDGRLNLQTAAHALYNHFKTSTAKGFMIFTNGWLLYTSNEEFTHDFSVLACTETVQKLKETRVQGRKHFYLNAVSMMTFSVPPIRKTLITH